MSSAKWLPFCLSLNVLNKRLTMISPFPDCCLSWTTAVANCNKNKSFLTIYILNCFDFKTCVLAFDIVPQQQKVVQGIVEDKDLPFLHDRLWISLWIKLISNELDFIIHVIASQLSRHSDIISNRLWCHQHNEDQERHGDDVLRSSFFTSFMDSLCCVRNNIMYVQYSCDKLFLRSLECFCVYFPHCFATREINTVKNNPLVSAETVRH